MELIKGRQELAKAMNFGKYPVLTIDMADSDDYGLKGCKVRIDAGTFSDGSPYWIRAELRVFSDECKLALCSYGTCLSNSFTYEDYKEMADYATAPIIKADQDVVVAIYDSKNRMPYAAILVRTGKSVSKFCSTPLTFENVDMSPYLWNAGIVPHKRED